MPWKLKRFSRPSVTEKKSFHLIITPLALNQYSLAKGVVIHLELNQTSTDSRSIEGQTISGTLTLESSISPLRRCYDPEGTVPPFHH